MWPLVYTSTWAGLPTMSHIDSVNREVWAQLLRAVLIRCCCCCCCVGFLPTYIVHLRYVNFYLAATVQCTCVHVYISSSIFYRIARKFGRKLNLVVWLSVFATAKLKSATISYLHTYVWQPLTKPPNLNPPIFLQWQLGPYRQI